LTSSRWRLSGIVTLEGSENTDSGVLWLVTVKTNDDVACTIYKDDGLASGNSVATGTADVSGCDNTGANAVEVALTEANDSGIGGSFWIHDYQGDGTAPIQVTLCTDEDLDSQWDGIEDLPGYDATDGCAEFIRVAGDDVMGKVLAMFKDRLGGHGSKEAWYIADAQRTYPDLRRIANPAQLRLACTFRALSFMVGRSHERANDTMYSDQRDYFNAEFERAMNALVLAVKGGNDDDAGDSTSASIQHMSRA